MARKNIIFICISILLTFTSCSGKVDASFLFEEKQSAPNSSQAIGKNVDFYSYLPQGTQMYFKAQIARFDLDSGLIYSEDVFLEQMIDQKMTLEAQNGTFNLESQQFSFQNNVVYQGTYGGRLHTDYLEVDNIHDTVSTNQDFQLHTVSGRIIGKGFQADRALTDIKIISAYGYEGEKNEK